MPRVIFDDKAEADEFIDAIRYACEPYARQPRMGELREELGPDIRSFTHTRNYIVIYRPLDDGIDVLRVLHSARNWQRVFRRG